MIAVNTNSICKRAQVFYYDYLCGEPREQIPAEVQAHIDKCRFCRAEVDRLRTVLAGAEERATERTGQTTSAVTTNLRLHFAYTGALVTCNTVRPFLPSLAIPALEVGVPTPITVHLDKCQECANDLEVIRQLNLTNKQLYRLGQLFADKPAEDSIRCSHAQVATLAVTLMAFQETNADILKHFCTCPDCREQLYQYRETVRTEFPPTEEAQSKFPCEEVSATDIFDYCFPYGIDPANDQYAKFRPALTSHLHGCPTCLSKMQQLHRKVSNIAERLDSEVVTCFTIEEQINEGTEPETSDLYADWPINVQVLDRAGLEPEISSADIGFPRSLKQRVTELNLRPFIKPIAVAAAVVLVALILLNVPAAKGIGLNQIYKALERIKNVHIAAFYQDESNLTEEIWISRTLNVKMSRTRTQCVLWDLNGKSRKSRDLNTGSITMTELDNNVLARVEQTMEGPLGLLPFNSIPEAPEGAAWQPVDDENMGATIPDTEVYDLMWTEKELDGSLVYNKWRGYINIETKLPNKVEWWEKRTEEGYKLLTIIKVAYPTAVEIRAAVRDAGF